MFTILSVLLVFVISRRHTFLCVGESVMLILPAVEVGLR